MLAGLGRIGQQFDLQQQIAGLRHRIVQMGLDQKVHKRSMCQKEWPPAPYPSDIAFVDCNDRATDKRGVDMIRDLTGPGAVAQPAGARRCLCGWSEALDHARREKGQGGNTDDGRARGRVKGIGGAQPEDSGTCADGSGSQCHALRRA